MSAEQVDPVMSPRDNGDVECWCCGAPAAQDRMVRLGNHPEVHLCVGCAHYAHQQAWEIEDGLKHGPAPRVRGALRRLRAEAIRRAWHQNAIAGRPIRWLGRHLP